MALNGIYLKILIHKLSVSVTILSTLEHVNLTENKKLTSCEIFNY